MDKSRQGTLQRCDEPATDDGWQQTIACQWANDGLILRTEPLPAPPAEPVVAVHHPLE